jgi:hypothetical protein
MRIQTGRDLGRIWLVAGIVFGASVGIVLLLGRDPSRRMPALWIGYVGLAAVGAALLLSAHWVDHSGPLSLRARLALHTLIAAALVLWLLALVFPFL